MSIDGQKIDEPKSVAAKSRLKQVGMILRILLVMAGTPTCFVCVKRLRFSDTKNYQAAAASLFGGHRLKPQFVGFRG